MSSRGSPSVTERDWRQTVLDAAQFYGWQAYFTWSSMHSPAGFPDLVLCRPPRLVFIELKAERGQATPAQDRWLRSLENVTLRPEVLLARPSDWEGIRACLE